MASSPTDELMPEVKVKEEAPVFFPILEVKRELEDAEKKNIIKSEVKDELKDIDSMVEIKREREIVAVKSEIEGFVSLAVKKGVENLKEVLKKTLVPLSSQIDEETSAENEKDTDLSKGKQEKDFDIDTHELNGNISDSWTSDSDTYKYKLNGEISDSTTVEEKYDQEGESSAQATEQDYEIKKETDPQEDVYARESKLWKSVIELLKQSGYAEKATDVNIRHIIGCLMNGMLPSEAEMHSLFNPPPGDDDDDDDSSSPKNDLIEPVKKDIGDSSECDRNEKEELSSMKKLKGGNEKPTARIHVQKKGASGNPQQAKVKNSNSIGSDSPSSPHHSPIRDVHLSGSDIDFEVPPSPPRYSLRKKARKSLVEERLSPTDDLYSDEWTPEPTSFLQNRRKKSFQNQMDTILSKVKKKGTEQSLNVSGEDNNEKSREREKGTKRRREDNKNSEKNNKKQFIIPESGNIKVTLDKSVCDELLKRQRASVKVVDKDKDSTKVSKDVLKMDDKKKDNRVNPTTNVTTEITTTTNIENDKVITSITKTEIRTITRTEIIKRLPQSTTNKKKDVKKQRLPPSKTSTATTTTSKVAETKNDKNSNIKTCALPDVHACTKCILAFSNQQLLQRHMFRLHYDEYLRLKNENFWEGFKDAPHLP